VLTRLCHARARLAQTLPSSFEDVFEAAERFAPSEAAAQLPPHAAQRATVAAQQRTSQTALIAERWRELLTDVLPSWVRPVRCHFSLQGTIALRWQN
jgi:NAD-dependent oxidoreductase involved in siderophore biosynthesis